MGIRRGFNGLLALALALGGPLAAAQNEADELHQLFEEDWAWRMEHYPEYATWVGYEGYDHLWTDYSPDAIERRDAYERERLERIQAIDRNALSPEDKLNYDLFLKDAQLEVEGQAFPGELMPITQMGGIQQSAASLVARMRNTTVADFENIIQRLETLEGRVEDVIALMERGLERGITPPKITLRAVPEQAANQIFDDATESPLYRPFASMPESINGTERERLRSAAKTAIAETCMPVFRRLHTFLKNDYVPNARESIAASDLPNGDDWYAYDVRVMTTTERSPKDIHELGLSEVERIRGEMERIADQAEFEGDFDEFLEYLRTDERFYYEDPRELMRGYRDIAKRIDGQLPRLFGKLPRLPYGVKKVPSYAEKSQTTAYYESGSREAGRAGFFFANTYKLDTRPKWEMEALTLHEAMPGHHLQISLAQELDGLPEFRKHGGPTAFVEGWGLYAESLGEELGLYEDPYAKFGQLTYEMWRAVRLVVDTGMHAFDWSRQRAIDYFAENSSKPIHDITVEIDRYIVWPGQALAYKLGELKMQELRQQARAELGADFDIRAFHDALLANGAVPLDVLEHHMHAWTEQQSATAD